MYVCVCGVLRSGSLLRLPLALTHWPCTRTCRYYSNIFQESGFAEMAAKYGSWFTWNGSPRALIYARNHSLVTDMESMIRLMRWVWSRVVITCVHRKLYSLHCYWTVHSTNLLASTHVSTAHCTAPYHWHFRYHCWYRLHYAVTVQVLFTVHRLRVYLIISTHAVTSSYSLYSVPSPTDRYNNFQHDPLSRCNCTPPYSGENAVSARSDLNPANGTYPFGALGHRCHGGTDNKV